MRSLISIILFLALYPIPAISQSSITSREKKLILDQVEATRFLYQATLNDVADRSQSASELQETVDGAFASGTSKRIFRNDRVMVDDETNELATAEQPKENDAKDYLLHFRDRFILKAGTNIECKKTSPPEIRSTPAGLVIRLFFTQTMTGTKGEGAPIQKMRVLKVMELLATPQSDGSWQAFIVAVNYASRPDKTADAPVVAVTGERNSSNRKAQHNYSEAYYKSMLNIGSAQLEHKNFGAAYYAFREAQCAAAIKIKAEAKRQTDEIYKSIRVLNLEPVETIYNQLMEEGKRTKHNYRYDLARKFYEYANEVAPSERAPTVELKDNIGGFEQKYEQLSEQLAKGAGNEALNASRLEIRTDEDNPFWHIIMARAYEQLGKPQAALLAYDEAIKLSRDLPDIYWWQAGLFMNMKNYKRAYTQLVKYQSLAEDPSDSKLLAKIAWCKGMELLDKPDGAIEALDSFRAALQYVPDYQDAKIRMAQALCTPLVRRDEDGKKIIRGVLRDDPSIGDAYYILSCIYDHEHSDAERMDALLKAVQYSRNNSRYYRELGELQLNKRLLDEAIKNLTTCVEMHNPLTAAIDSGDKTIARWKLGKCDYYLNRFEAAEKRYMEYFDSGRNPVRTEFYADMINLYLKMRRLSEAKVWATRVPYDISTTLLSKGILSYMSNESQPLFEGLIDSALKRGLKEEEFRNAPNIQEIYDRSERIRQLVYDKWKLKLKRS